MRIAVLKRPKRHLESQEPVTCATTDAKYTPGGSRGRPYGPGRVTRIAGGAPGC
jgi:hypothetical protein